MRCGLAALALGIFALALLLASPAWAQPEARMALMSAADVLNARRCAPPFGCRREQRKAPGRAAAAKQALLALIDAAAMQAGVPRATARALIQVESGFNPRARNGSCLGLTQIKCRTARGLGFAGPCAALLDPATNLRFGLRHAALALRRGSIGFHESGLHARHVSRAYVARISAASKRAFTPVFTHERAFTPVLTQEEMR
jgi:soluble lytic murein transglycosylase-like protein